MPIYEVEDSVTGRILELEGDSPPTDEELEDLFQQYAEQPVEVAEPEPAPEPEPVTYKPTEPGGLGIAEATVGLPTEYLEEPEAPSAAAEVPVAGADTVPPTPEREEPPTPGEMLAPPEYQPPGKAEPGVIERGKAFVRGMGKDAIAGITQKVAPGVVALPFAGGQVIIPEESIALKEGEKVGGAVGRLATELPQIAAMFAALPASAISIGTLKAMPKFARVISLLGQRAGKGALVGGTFAAAKGEGLKEIATEAGLWAGLETVFGPASRVFRKWRAGEKLAQQDIRSLEDRASKLLEDIGRIEKEMGITPAKFAEQAENIAQRRTRVLNDLMATHIEKKTHTPEMEGRARDLLNQLDDEQLTFFDGLVQENKRLGTLAYTDQLTRLNNRNFAVEQGLLQERVIRDATGREITQPIVNRQTAILDIDDFGKINKKHGEHRGDGVLRSLGNIINDITGGKMFNIRYGGEEIMLIPKKKIPDEQLGDVLQAIRKEIFGRDFGGGLKGVNFSAGVGKNLERAVMDMRLAKKVPGKGKTFIGGKEYAGKPIQIQPGEKGIPRVRVTDRPGVGRKGRPETAEKAEVPKAAPKPKAPPVKPPPPKPKPKKPPDDERLKLQVSEERGPLIKKPTESQLEVFEAAGAKPKPGIRQAIGEKFGFGKKDKVPEAAKKIHKETVTNIQLQEFENARYINFVQRHAPSQKEQEALSFLVERTGVPKALNRPDLEAIVKNPSPKLKKMADIARRHSDLTGDYLAKNAQHIDFEAIENYVPHIWDIPKNKISEATNYFITQNPFLKKRVIKTIEEGVKMGYKPKTLNYVELTALHDKIAIRATENKKLVEGLKALEDESGIKLIQRADQAPENWIPVDHPAMRKAALFRAETKEVVPMDVRKAMGMDGRKVTQYTTPDGKTKTLSVPKSVADLKKEGVATKTVTIQTMGYLPVKVAPELEPLMKSVFGKRIKMPAAQIYEVFNALNKKTQLSISLFHHTALSETSVATIGPMKTADILLNVKKIYRALAKNDYTVFRKHKWSRDAIKDGLQLGALTDIQRSFVDNVLKAAETKLTGLSKVTGYPAKFIRKANQVWDKALWDYLHNELKINAHYSLKAKKLAKLKNPTQKQIDKTGEEVAQFVNDTFGGQNWERMMTNPQNLQIAQWALLSPDWTLSTLRQAAAPTGLGALSRESAHIRRSMGFRFWRNALLYFGVGMNALNYALSKADNAEQRNVPWAKGEGKFMWQNDPGHKTHLFAGRYEDGTKRYIRWGKQFREFPEMIYDQMAGQISPLSASVKKIGGKLAPFWQVASQVFTGSSLGGFRNKEIANKHGWTWVGGVARTMIKMPLPFSTRSITDMRKEFKFTDLIAPSSKGMTYFKARKMFKSAIAHRNQRMVEAIFRAAVENKLNAFDIFEAAVIDLKAEASGEARRLLREKKKKPETLREEEAKVKEDERQMEMEFILNNWKAAMDAARERYKAYLTEEELLEEKTK